MGEGCFIGLAGFLGDLFTSTLRMGDFAGEQRRSSSWFTVTLFGDAVGNRVDLFGWIDGDLQGVRVFRAGLRGVRKVGDLASFTGEQKRFFDGVEGAGDRLGLAGDLLNLTGDFCGLSSRSAMFSAEILPGLNKGPFLVGA